MNRNTFFIISAIIVLLLFGCKEVDTCHPGGEVYTLKACLKSTKAYQIYLIEKFKGFFIKVDKMYLISDGKADFENKNETAKDKIEEFIQRDKEIEDTDELNPVYYVAIGSKDYELKIVSVKTIEALSVFEISGNDMPDVSQWELKDLKEGERLCMVNLGNDDSNLKGYVTNAGGAYIFQPVLEGNDKPEEEKCYAGRPLVNSDGKLVGICSGYHDVNKSFDVLSGTYIEKEIRDMQQVDISLWVYVVKWGGGFILILFGLYFVPKTKYLLKKVRHTKESVNHYGKLILSKEGQPIGEYSINAQGITVGRDQEKSQLVITDSVVSRIHCWIGPRQGTSMFVEDLGSSNGTYLNGEKIIKVSLKHGDIISLGKDTNYNLLYKAS